MNRQALILLAILMVSSTAVLLAGAGPAASRAPQWEYAVYRSIGSRYQWQTPDAEISVRGLDDFLREVGLKEVMSDRTVETELINHFGKQGWELIQMSPPGEGRATWVFWFKRPRT
jgi:hypothetical protein